MKIKSYLFLLPYLVFLIITLITYSPFFIEGKIPLAADIILGSFHPWLDSRWDNYSTNFPVLNGEIYDSPTSFYPWRYKAVESLKSGQIPLFDPSSYMGEQFFSFALTGLFYPLNFISFLLPFNLAWGILVALTPLLAASFFYLYIKQKVENIYIQTIFSICYAYSAFIALQTTFISTAHSIIYLPLILLAIDKLTQKFSAKYLLVLLGGLISSLLAGFLPGSFFLVIFSFSYLLYKTFYNKKLFLFLSFLFLLSAIITSFQLLPFISTLNQSTRLSNYGVDPTKSETFSFFVDFKFFITTLIPDYFGNPGKWNYWQRPNYYEFNNYSGVIVFLGGIVFLLTKNIWSKVKFFVVSLIVVFILTTPNPLGQFPYYHSWPVFSSMTPSRLLLLIQFCLIVISAMTFDYLIKAKINTKTIVAKLSIPLVIILVIILFTILGWKQLIYIPDFQPNHFYISLRNSLIPLVLSFSILTLFILYKKFNKSLFLVLILLITSIDLIRQTSFFRPFIKPELIFAKTSTINFLQQNSANYRFMITDPTLLPSNLQMFYNLESVDGRGPVFADQYNKFIATLNKNTQESQISRFSRTVFFTNYNSPRLDILNIKYILSLKDLDNQNLKLVKKEGETRIYENSNLLEQSWIVKETEHITKEEDILNKLKSAEFNPSDKVIISSDLKDVQFTTTKSSVKNYQKQNNQINIQTQGDGILVLSLQFNKNWKAFINNQPTQLHQVNYNQVGLTLPPGDNQIVLSYKPDSFYQGLYLTIVGILIFLGIALISILKPQLFHTLYNNHPTKPS